MANRTTRTPKKESAFLDTLRDGQSVTAACLASGLARRTVYQWRDDDETFKTAWDEAVDEGTDRMEDEAYRRAVQGTTKPVYQSGKRVGELQEFSDTLMIFMLKARRPQKFKERVAVGGDEGAPPIRTEDAAATARAEIASRVAGIAAAARTGGGDPKPE